MIPFDRVIWTAQECADYLQVTVDFFLRSVVTAEGFPQELPNVPGHWHAKAVSDWATGPGFSSKPRLRRQATCVLYRHFAADGVLLYVGISIQPLARLYQHDRDSRWFHLVRRIELEHYASISEAAAAEREAIQTEKPKFNILHVR